MTNATDPSGLSSLWFHAVDYPLGALEMGLTFVAGAINNFTLGIWKLLYTTIRGDDGNITYKGTFKTGERVEAVAEIIVTGGSAYLKGAAGKVIARQLAKDSAEGVSRGLSLKAAERIAREKIERELRREARKKFGDFQGMVHHRLTLWGHFGKGVPKHAKESLFPTLGVRWLANHRRNLVGVSTYKQHASIHSKMYASEQALMTVVGPWITGARTVGMFIREFEIDVKVNVTCNPRSPSHGEREPSLPFL